MFKRVSLLFSLLLISACGGSSGPSIECIDAGDCGASGQVQACLNNTCVDVDCLASSDCPIGKFCDAEADSYECKLGCQDDGDCLAGSECQEGSCVDYGCRSTILDCDFGQMCNTQTGQCQEAQGPFCQSCNTANDMPGETVTCTLFGLPQEIPIPAGNTDCGGAGFGCLSDGGLLGGGTCGVPCDPNNPVACPPGFGCFMVGMDPSQGGYSCPPSALDPETGWLIIGTYCMDAVGGCPQ